MKILIDADGCPVVDIAVSVAVKYNIDCIICCDTSHHFDIEGAETLTVSKGSDSTDFALVGMLSKGDIAVTQDYGLAAMCLSMGGYAINQDGMVYDDCNISALLNFRYISKKIRDSGGRLKGKPKRRGNQNLEFKAALTALVESVLDK